MVVKETKGNVMEMSHHRVTLVLLAGLVLASSAFRAPAAQTLADQADEVVRTRIEAAGTPPQITVGHELIYASAALPLFYERRGYRLAWSGENGPLPRADALLAAVGDAESEGLRPNDYHLKSAQRLIQDVRGSWGRQGPQLLHKLVELDLLLTDAFLVYGSHLFMGRINPETIDPEWVASRRQADMAEMLRAALEAGHIHENLKNLLPQQPGYGKLKRVLARYREMKSEGGWPEVPDGPKLQQGDRGERVTALRKRLSASGDSSLEKTAQPDSFDSHLSQAVRTFQERHGLGADGIVGPATLQALNVSVQERIRQIEVNLERWRWLPQDLGEAYVLVNIANFELDVVKQAQPIMTMRAIVGKHYRRTPVFSDKITYLVLSPFWHVPPSLAVEDILPQARKDPNYLTDQRIRVFQGWGADAKEIDPKTVDWSKVSAKTFGYRLRQDPGPKNVLGRVKFMFPNKFNVYLHDTPSPQLFTKTERTFSSGCIRIEKAIDLAEYLLEDDPTWTRERIIAVADKGVEQTVPLPRPVPIHLLYWTAWADEDGTVDFRKDIYGRDILVAEALGEKPPEAAESPGNGVAR